ncbi:helix-turn-helix domain-containing protein [Streptomyces erythrochromogenes]|uniref:helix-turn-helix domain-containing protein n=1 Tax=Streptomyces erythrochromogenes TaxID=285574 RepID=UPI002250010D|nr:helix-turn-helix domain-containing protein [Streptomyces erythrochromogenes]MCX5584951.1 helix-turn-helix domain-containing protein [Streptomyces erythrochromogenes]
MTRSVEDLPTPQERRRLREAAELTLDEVAAAVGVTVATVRHWESGRTNPRGRKHDMYARFLDGLAALPVAADTTGPPDRADRADSADPLLVAVAVAPGAGAEAEAGAGAGGSPAAPDGAAVTTDVPDTGSSANGAVTRPAVRPVHGPADAFDTLYDRAAPVLALQAYLLTGRRALALEAVDRAFTRAWDQWPEVAADPDPESWVRAIAYEYALSPWHRFRRAHRRPDRPPADPADRILLDALLALSRIHRRTVLLYDGVGLDLPDTAAETEATTLAAGNRILHAHADLAARIPELADVPVEKQSAALRERLVALRPPFPLDPRPAAAVRGGGERRGRQWTRATLGLTAMITAATAYTVTTAPTRYDPPPAPGESVTGVPALSGPQQLTERSRQLHDKLRADPQAGPARITPKIE